MLVRLPNIQRSVQRAKAALREIVYQASDGRQTVKACCICDRLIGYRKEKVITLGELKAVQKRFEPTEDDKARKTYKVGCYNLRKGKYRFMKSMLLSPRSYKKMGPKSQEGLGCCQECFTKKCTMLKESTFLPAYAIANGWCIGDAPKVVRELYEVELAVLSPARINKHVFAFQAGRHCTIKGWHSLYYNDLSHFEAVKDRVREVVPGPTISVILAGPFTSHQKAAALTRTTIRWEKVEAALKWLRANNHLYADFELGDRRDVVPIVVDER